MLRAPHQPRASWCAFNALQQYSCVGQTSLCTSLVTFGGIILCKWALPCLQVHWGTRTQEVHGLGRPAPSCVLNTHGNPERLRGAPAYFGEGTRMIWRTACRRCCCGVGACLAGADCCRMPSRKPARAAQSTMASCSTATRTTGHCCRPAPLARWSLIWPPRGSRPRSAGCTPAGCRAGRCCMPCAWRPRCVWSADRAVCSSVSRVSLLSAALQRLAKWRSQPWHCDLTWIRERHASLQQYVGDACTAFAHYYLNFCRCWDGLGLVTLSLPAGPCGAGMRRPRRRCCRRAHQPGRRSARSFRSAQRCRAHADRPADVPAAGAIPGVLAWVCTSAAKLTLAALPTSLQVVLTRFHSVLAADSACRTSVKAGLPASMPLAM